MTWWRGKHSNLWTMADARSRRARGSWCARHAAIVRSGLGRFWRRASRCGPAPMRRALSVISALAPDDLAGLVRAALHRGWDEDAEARLIEREEDER